MTPLGYVPYDRIEIEDIPDGPGMLFHHQELGRSGCGACGWSGVATRTGGRRVGRPREYMPGMVGYRVVDSERSDMCPACQPDYTQEDIERELRAGRILARQPPRRRSAKVARNAPCPCGSGRKAKKCCHA